MADDGDADLVGAFEIEEEAIVAATQPKADERRFKLLDVAAAFG